MKIKKIDKLKIIARSIGIWMNHIVLGVFLLISFILFLNKDVILDEPVATNSNSSIELRLDGNHVLRQPWLASKKKIAGITVSTSNGAELSGTMELHFYQDDALVASPIALSLEANADNELDFWFQKPSEIQPGERYEIQLRGVSETSDTLLIHADSSHYGCFINDIDTEQAAGVTVKYIKNSRIFWVYLILLVLFAYSFGLMLLFKKDFADVIGMAVAVIGAQIYLFGIFGLLKTGVILVIIGSFLLIVLELLVLIKSKRKITDYFSPTVFSFIFLFFIIIIKSQNLFRVEWDEFSHWGLVVKDMFYSDSFSNYDGTNTLMPFYPPFLAIIQYLFLFCNQVFSEGMLFAAYQMMEISFLIILLKRIFLCRLRTVVAGVVIMLLLPLQFFSNSYNSIYADSMLGILAAYVLICYFTEELKLFNMIRISLGLFALVMVKETGVIIAGITFLIMLADIIYKNKKIICRENWKALAFLGSIGISYVSWQIYLITPISQMIPRLINGKEQALEGSGSIAVAETASDNIVSIAERTSGLAPLDLLLGKATAEQYQIMKDYITEAFSGPHFKIGTVYFSAIDVLLTLFLIALMISLKSWLGRRSSMVFRGLVWTVLGSLLYFGFYMLTYVYIFDPVHLVATGDFNSYERYQGTYLSAVYILFISMVFIFITENLNSQSKKQNEYKIVLILVILLILTPVEGLYTKPTEKMERLDVLYGYDEIAETFRGFADRSDKVYFVCNDSGGYSSLLFLDAILPVHTDWLIQDIHATEGSRTVITSEEWREELIRDYEYVFVLYADPLFKTQYKDLFEDIEQLSGGDVFKVMKAQEETWILKHIANVSIKDYE